MDDASDESLEEREFDGSLSELVDSALKNGRKNHHEDGYILRAEVTLQNGRKYEVHGSALRFRAEGIEIIRNWRRSREQRAGEPPAEIPSSWLFHPWAMVEQIEYQELFFPDGAQSHGEENA